jgi:DNA-binding response OmpR family regulator
MNAANILLISNNASLRALIQGTLIVAGYKVDTTYKGVNGLTLALLKPFDLFLIDDDIPDMSRLDLIAQIKGAQALENIPIVAVTDNLEQNECWHYINAGAQGCLFQPFTRQQRTSLAD